MMAKLTKLEARMHAEAEALLAKPEPTHEDRLFIFEHWQESANHINSAAGAFFTPFDYAADVALEIPYGARIIDLCAGIGTLSYALQYRGHEVANITCLELDPAYAQLGKRIIPDAHWIEGSIFDLPDLGHFDYVISNPPFGRIKNSGVAPRYKGAEFQFKVIDIAADIADHGVFILPQNAAPFTYSGAPFYDWNPGREYVKFEKTTRIRLDAGIGVDSTCYPAFHGTPVRTEVCVTDYTERPRDTLFEETA